MIPTEYYVIVSSIIAGIGVYGLIVQRSAIRMLISVELMFNATLLVLITFMGFINPINGSILALLVIALASAEIGVVIPIIVLAFRTFKTTDVTKASKMKR